MSETSYHFSAPVQIRMSDLDPFVHVNNGAQCHLFDYGRSSYLQELLQQKIDWKTMDLVLVHIDLDFMHPILFTDQIVCDCMIYEVGNKSIKMIQQLRDTETNEVKTICKSVLVTINRATGEPIPVSEEYQEVIREFEER